MTNIVNISDAEIQIELNRLEEKYGTEALWKEYARRVSARLGVSDQGMPVAVCFQKSQTETNARTYISETDLAEFRAYAKTTPWIPRSGIAPSEHIKTHFAKWLGRGLMREHIASVQPNLAAAYAKEIERHPDHRVEGLESRPSAKLAAGAPRAPSTRPIAELSDEERKARRKNGTQAKRTWRVRQRSNQGPH